MTFWSVRQTGIFLARKKQWEVDRGIFSFLFSPQETSWTGGTRLACRVNFIKLAKQPKISIDLTTKSPTEEKKNSQSELTRTIPDSPAQTATGPKYNWIRAQFTRLCFDCVIIGPGHFDPPQMSFRLTFELNSSFHFHNVELSLWPQPETQRERERERLEMSLKASNSGKNLILPVSDSPRDLERERLVGDDNDEKLFRGSAMTRRGAYAAISYMACAGKLRSLQFDALFVPKNYKFKF